MSVIVLKVALYIFIETNSLHFMTLMCVELFPYIKIQECLWHNL